MNIIYCAEWALYKKQPHNILSKHEAKEKFINDGTYAAVLYENDNVKNVIEIDEVSLTVRFYDDNLDNYLIYGFVKRDGKLFMNMACHYAYQNHEKNEHMIFNFKENGEMIAEKMNYVTGEVEERLAVVDVSCNWEEFPEFGEYYDVIRVEREKKN